MRACLLVALLSVLVAAFAGLRVCHKLVVRVPVFARFTRVWCVFVTHPFLIFITYRYECFFSFSVP